MSDLTQLRDHARTIANWQSGPPRAACKETTIFGYPKPPDHANCGGLNCGCECHRPTDADRALWTRIADEIDAYLANDPEVVGAPASETEALW